MALRQLIGRRYLSVRLSNRILGLKPPSKRCLLRTSAHSTNEKSEIAVTSALLSSKFSDFARSLVEEESQKEAKMEIISDLNKCLKLKGTDFGLIAVGSSVSGLGMNDSDLDLCMIIDPSINTLAEEETLELRRMFRAALQRYNKERGQVANIEPVGREKVPIAKFDVRGIPCNVSFNNIIDIR